MKHISHIINAVLSEVKDASEQQRLIRISMVEDYMKAKILLAGWGVKGHEDYTNDPVAVFDYAYNLHLEELDKGIESLKSDISKYVMELHWPNGRWTKTEPPQPEF